MRLGLIVICESPLQAALVSGQFALAVELLRFLIPPGESQAFLAAAAGQSERPGDSGSAPPADLPSHGVSGIVELSSIHCFVADVLPSCLVTR